MLKKLSISNYALINQLVFNPAEGFTVITGETGAGKSIILGALSLLLGKRSEGTDLFDSKRKCILEAVFKTKSKQVSQFLATQDFDQNPEVILRREILPSGKTRGFINDTPANLQQLREVGQLLIDIHSQHGHLLLKDHNFQLSVLDAYAGIQSNVEKFSIEYFKWIGFKKKLDQLKEEQAQLDLDRDYFDFLYNELNEVNVQEGELADKELALNQLQHSEEIQGSLSSACQAFEDEGGQIISVLSKVEGLLEGIAEYSPQTKELHRRVKECRIELEDVKSEMDVLSSSVESDPEKLLEYTERINAINSLLHKHRVTSEQELIEKKTELEDKLQSVSNLGEQIELVESQCAIQRQLLEKLGADLNRHRIAIHQQLEKTVESILKKLGIKEAQIKWNLSTRNEPNEVGFDQAELLFSANKGKEPKELLKVASGGELSRIMLSIKSILAERGNLPTIIFDEIDTGVSGDIANQMGSIMQAMAKKMQVVSITHLPQVAAKGDLHFTVDKSIDNNRTTTSMSKLIGEERVFELAKMLSGEQVSNVAKENARILLNN